MAYNERQAHINRIMLATTYKNEPQVPVNLPPHYRGDFGNSMGVVVNGLPIWIPLDGNTYYIPQTYADIVAQKKRQADLRELRQGSLSDVSRNFESSPGELKFFE